MCSGELTFLGEVVVLIQILIPKLLTIGKYEGWRRGWNSGRKSSTIRGRLGRRKNTSSYYKYCKGRMKELGRGGVLALLVVQVVQLVVLSQRLT